MLETILFFVYLILAFSEIYTAKRYVKARSNSEQFYHYGIATNAIQVVMAIYLMIVFQIDKFGIFAGMFLFLFGTFVPYVYGIVEGLRERKEQAEINDKSDHKSTVFFWTTPPDHAKDGDIWFKLNEDGTTTPFYCTRRNKLKTDWSLLRNTR
jgi:hypothetical protein